MKFTLLLSLLTSALAAFNAQLFSQFLLLDRYGRNGGGRNCYWTPPRNGLPPRRRCRRTNNNNDLFKLALFAALQPTPAPATGGGCFPDAMTLERQTETGSEFVSIANLTLGDEIRCLKAAQGSRTEAPKMGWCKFVARGHNLEEAMQYEQVFFEGEGQDNMIAATDGHLIWSSRDRSLKGTVDPSKISIKNSMFVPISTVKPGDVIIVERNNQLQYRVVTDHRQANMSGVRNPDFTDGGLPIINGVLVTSSASSSRGGHWGTYFQTIWFEDAKFANVSAATAEMRSHAFFLGQKAGGIKVDPECLMDRLLEDEADGIDITNFDTYDSFVKAYAASCASYPSLINLGKKLMETLEPTLMEAVDPLMEAVTPLMEATGPLA